MVESSAVRKLNIAIIGGTGAIGKEIVRHAANMEQVGEVRVIARRKLDEWEGN